MNDEIEAMLRAEYHGEVDVEREIRRLHQTNEHLPSNPEEDQRIRDIVEAVDAEIEANEAQTLVPRESFTRLSANRREELAAGRHRVIAAYFGAEQSINAASDASDEMLAAHRRARRSSRTASAKLGSAHLPLRYLIAEAVIGAVLVAAVVMLLITSQPLGFNTRTLGTIATAAAFIAVTSSRGLRQRVATLERHRTAKRVGAYEAAAREALLQLELHWTDLLASMREAVDDVIEQGAHRALEAPIKTTEDVLDRYTSNHLAALLNREAQRRRAEIWRETGGQDFEEDAVVSLPSPETRGQSAE